MKHTDATGYGSWKVTFRYSEMKGNIGKKSGIGGAVLLFFPPQTLFFKTLHHSRQKGSRFTYQS
jgi:hypothetical protein